jgi:hypothetical protein
MNTKKRFYLSAPFISVAIIAMLFLIGCEYFADPSDPVPSGPTIPLAGTYTVDGAAPTVAGHIWRNGTTTIQVFDTALKTYVLGNGNYALMDALLTGLQAGDMVTFNAGSKINAVTKAATLTPSTITVGTNLPATAFAPALTLQGPTGGVPIKITGSPLAAGTVVTLKATAPAKYDLYGVETTVVTGSDATATVGTTATEWTLDAGNTGATVEITSGSAVTKLTVDTTTPTSGIKVSQSGVEIVKAAAALRVDISGLTTAGNTVRLTGDAQPFALTTIPGTAAYVDNPAGTVIGGTKVYTYASSGGGVANVAFASPTTTGFSLTNTSGVTATVTVTTP